jgi:hypothetical protein
VQLVEARGDAGVLVLALDAEREDAQPGLGRIEQRLRRLLVVLALEEAEEASVVALELVQHAIDLRGDAADRAPVAPGEEVLGLAVLEPRVLLAVEKLGRSKTSGGTQFGSLR